MLNSILVKFIGTKNERELKRLQPYVEAINALEPEFAPLSDDDLRAKTAEFKGRLEQGASLQDLLIEAYAAVREVARRRVDMRPFDVQLIGAVVLHQGKIAEMKTGEGKTLVATMPAYLDALTGNGVHIITVNDYLARRDTEWMGDIYRGLGLSVGCIQSEMPTEERKEAYASDITYGTNNEFGFDYLRDNMKFRLEDFAQRGHRYGIVDEVDSILIDESRTPLIISGPSEESTELYYAVDRLIPRLRRENHFQVDEKEHTVSLTEDGVEKAEQFLRVENLYNPRHMEILHHIHQALRAHMLFKRDSDYVVTDGRVVIVDEFTGRLMPGRRYSDGLHQALEAKEGVRIERENQTIASITFQNYFRMYEKLAGMTGTAATEATEFEKIYGLDVVVVPTNMLLRRTHYPDVIYRTKKEKWESVVEEIEGLHEERRPVLVGTISIEDSERLSRMLKRHRISHHVLNAKHHEKEAEIIADAGQPRAVTIATNMAGRGTDIVLGSGVAERGGLHVLGTERHEARRIDNQLRGRTGRQGDPGSSRFILSLEDDLLRIFGSDRISGLMRSLGMEEGVPIESKLITRQIEKAQQRVESRNFDIRKHLLEYDDVMHRQREAVYSMRQEVLAGKRARQFVLDLTYGILQDILERHAHPDHDPLDWDLEGLRKAIHQQFGINPPLDSLVHEERLNHQELLETFYEKLESIYTEKEEKLGTPLMREFETMVMLQVIDSQWKDHLYGLDHLKEGIGLRGYGQRDPLIEYKRESFEMFMEMQQRVEDNIIQYLFLLDPVLEEGPRRKEQVLFYNDPAASTGTEMTQPYRREQRKVGRNEPCPCGSGKKYKKCCGQ